MDTETGTTCSHGVIPGRSVGGALRPWPFIAAVSAVYLLGIAGQMLTAPALLGRVGLSPFLLMQAALTLVWFMLHAQRLRDANQSLAPAQGIAAIHVLAVVLLVLIGVFFRENMPAEGWTPESIALVRRLVGFSRGASDPLTILGLIACVALLLAPAFSVWAALQPGRAA